MKLSLRSLLCILLAAGLPALVFAAAYSFDFKTEKKKLEGKRTQKIDRQVSDEKWCYDVTIQNHSFKDIANVNVKYIVFYKAEHGGSKVVKEKHKSGSTTAAMLQNNGNFAFQTEPIELTKTQLVGGFYWENGAKTRAHDSLTGIWVRLYQGGTMIGEYADPPSLTSGIWPEKDEAD